MNGRVLPIAAALLSALIPASILKAQVALPAPSTLPGSAAPAPALPAPNYTKWKSFDLLLEADQRQTETLLPPVLLGDRLLMASWAQYRGRVGNFDPENRTIDLYELDTKSGSKTRLSSMPQPVDPTRGDTTIMNAPFGPKAMIWKNYYVLATFSDGVLLLPVNDKDKPRKIGKEQGLPSVAVQAAAIAGDTLYLATGTADEPCSFVACDLPTGKCTLIAKAALPTPRPANGKAPAPGAPPKSPFTADAATFVPAMVADAPAGKVYFVANHRNTRQGGLWQYDPATKSFTHRLAINTYQPYADSFFMPTLWSLGRERVLVFLTSGGTETSFWFDMATAKGQWFVRPPNIDYTKLAVPEDKPLVADKIDRQLRQELISGLHVITPPRDGWVWHVGSLTKEERNDGQYKRIPMAPGYLGRVRLVDLHEEYFPHEAITEGGGTVGRPLVLPDGNLIFLSNGKVFRAAPP